MLNRDLIFIFGKSFLLAGIFILIFLLFRSKIMCVDDKNCQQTEVCSFMFCQNIQQVVEPTIIEQEDQGYERDRYRSKDKENTKIDKTNNIDLTKNATSEILTNTWCQKSCVYNHLTEETLEKKYHLSEIPSELRCDHLKNFYDHEFKKCMSEVNLDITKDQHCEKVAHASCVMQCANAKLEQRGCHSEDPPFYYCKNTANSNRCLTDVTPNLEGWYCMCYQEMIETQAYELTVCRRKEEECKALQEKVLWASHPKGIIIPDSLQRECTYISTVYPWREKQSDYSKWETSKYIDKEKKLALQSFQGCLLPNGKRTVEELVHIKKEKKIEFFQRLYSDYMRLPDDETMLNCMLQQLPESLLIFSKRDDKLSFMQFEKNKKYCDLQLTREYP